MARAMQKVLQDQHLVGQSIHVANKQGGNGEVGWIYMKDKDAHTLAVFSSLLLTNILLGHSKLSYRDFTPLATLMTEWEVVAVAKDSPIQTVKELMKKLEADPSSMKIAVAPGMGNDDHLSFIQACKTYGVNFENLDLLIFASGGDTASALLGHHVDVATMSVSEAKSQYEQGNFRLLAVTSPQRLEQMPDVPTWKEQGVQMEFPHWRGVMGPPNMSKEEISYWDKALGAMVQTNEWKAILKTYGWQPFYKNSAETKAFLEQQNKMYADLVKESGLVR